MAENKLNITRRHFLQQTPIAAVGSAALIGAASCQSLSLGEKTKAPHPLMIKPADVILFQGDSITDAKRDRDNENLPNDPTALGYGYAFLAASLLTEKFPSLKLKFYNRGISGNKVYQLAQRWDKDCLSLKPNMISILIGVNDCWHTLAKTADIPPERYLQEYRDLLAQTRTELPICRLIIGEPFMLNCGYVKQDWFAILKKYQSAAKELAGQFDAQFIPYQSLFNDALKIAPPEYWTTDGIHPTPAGSALMAKAWLETVCASSEEYKSPQKKS